MLAPDLTGGRKAPWGCLTFLQAADPRRMLEVALQKCPFISIKWRAFFSAWECGGGLWLCALPLEWMHSKLEKQKCPSSSSPLLPRHVAVTPSAPAALPQALGVAERGWGQASTAGNILPVRNLVTSPCTRSKNNLWSTVSSDETRLLLGDI